MSNDRRSCPISVLIAVKNEERNLGHCLDSLRGWADEVVVIDSQSSDDTVVVAQSHGATVVQFHYTGGWPKKRQWALDTYPFRNEWILLLDADEILLEETKKEIAAAITNPAMTGYYLSFRIFFLGRMLRFGDTQLRKLALFRKGQGHYEKRLEQQDSSMQDMEIHEHVVVNGKVGLIHAPVHHRNINSLARYIDKHNAYSTWEANVALFGSLGELPPSLFGNQAQRRRWLKKLFLSWPGSPLLFFLFKYILKLGFMDGIPGLIYCTFQGIQIFHVKAKIYELRQAREQEKEIS
jgi:glycosyltransferase involved in cell wall biosynthesis